MQILDPSRTPDDLIEQDSGARWSAFFDDDPNGFTVLTGLGDQLYHAPDGEMIGLMRRYEAAERAGRLAVVGVQAATDGDMRRLLGSGKEANVFAMGPFAVREQLGISRGYYAAIGGLQRMDALNGAVEYGLPRWLNLPAHYALHADPNTQKSYIIMKRINGGLTAEDVIEYPEFPEERAHRRGLVERTLGPHIDEAKTAVPELFDAAHGILVAALRSRGKDPSKYLTDWEPRNALIERLPAPVAGSRYSVHIIDQYRA